MAEWVKGDWVSFTVKSLSDTNIIAGVLSEEKKARFSERLR
jgi:hypothetical protein